jgi:hypothetical protein
MKIERAYLGDALRRLRGRSRSDVTRHLAYRTAGETVRPGTYECTLCGRAVDISRPGPLPLSAACDGCEFAGLASAAELEAADPLCPTRKSKSDQQAA